MSQPTNLIAVTKFLVIVAVGFLYIDLSLLGRSSAQAETSDELPKVWTLHKEKKVELKADSRGHFSTHALVNNKTINLLVDTGASFISLTRADARRLGIKLETLNYNLRMQTANGVTRAAPVTLRVVKVGSIEVRDVQAVVHENEGLNQSLLGMSFLSALRSFSASENMLVLLQ